MTEKQFVGFKAPKDTVELAKSKLAHGEMSEILRQRLASVAHGTDVAEETRIKDNLEELRESRRDKLQEIQNLQNDVDEIERKIGRKEERLDVLREQEGQYDGVLAMLEEDLHGGMRIFTESGKVKRAAELGDCTVQDVINDLKERNTDVPDQAFRKAKPQEEGNWQDEIDEGGSLL